MSNCDTRLQDVFSNVMKISPSQIDRAAPREILAYWKSLKHISLIVEVEKAFSISIPSAEAVTIDTYQKLLDKVHTKLGIAIDLGSADQKPPIIAEPTLSLKKESVKRGLMSRIFG